MEETKRKGSAKRSGDAANDVVPVDLKMSGCASWIKQCRVFHWTPVGRWFTLFVVGRTFGIIRNQPCVVVGCLNLIDC